MNSHRFFIALLPPPEIQASVNQIKRYFERHYSSRKAFNSPPHITLQAPFAWSSEQDLAELIEGLKGFAVERGEVAIALRNFGAFPPRVIYIAVVQGWELMALQQDLATFMEKKYGISDHRYRSFCPHMTVAFRDLTKAAFHQAWPEYQKKTLTFNFIAQYLTLLRHDGQRWQIYQSYSLGASSNDL